LSLVKIRWLKFIYCLAKIHCIVPKRNLRATDVRSYYYDKSFTVILFYAFNTIMIKTFLQIVLKQFVFIHPITVSPKHEYYSSISNYCCYCVQLTGGVKGGLICFSNIIPKLYRLIHGMDLSFLTVVILSSGLMHSSYNNNFNNYKCKNTSHRYFNRSLMKNFDQE